MAETHTNADKTGYFIAFCVELYKNAHSLTGEEVVNIFSNQRVMKYLSDNYEVLHTQSPQWILEELNDFIKK